MGKYKKSLSLNESNQTSICDQNLTFKSEFVRSGQVGALDLQTSIN